MKKQINVIRESCDGWYEENEFITKEHLEDKMDLLKDKVNELIEVINSLSPSDSKEEEGK